MKKIVLFLALLFAFQLAFADCSFSTKSATEFNLEFDVQPNFISDVKLSIVAPYSEACLRAQGVDGNSFECSEAMLPANDAFFKSLGFFSGKGKCNAFFKDGFLTLDFSTQTDMLVNNLANNNVEVSFREWSVVSSDNEASLKNTLVIKVPVGAKISAFYPMSDPIGKADFEQGVVLWEPIPSKTPSVKFTMPDNSGVFVFGIVGVILLILIASVGGFFFLNKNKQSNTLQQAKTIKAKMVVLEQDFMKGKMDETTYRRLMEQYQIQLTELKVELAKTK